MLSAVAVSTIALACLLGGAVLGMVLRKFLPEHHLSEESKYIVRLGTGLLATLSALVLGLLIASAKSSFEGKADEIKQGAAKIILLDRNLRHYGAQADEARALLRQMTIAQADLAWLETSAPAGGGPAAVPGGIEDVQVALRALTPSTDAQRWLQTRALELSGELAQMRWLTIDQHGGSVPTPFVVALVSWLAIIFISLGLFAPHHTTAYAVIVASALSVSSAIFLILELDRPFEGPIKVSDAPLRAAIAEMSR